MFSSTDCQPPTSSQLECARSQCRGNLEFCPHGKKPPFLASFQVNSSSQWQIRPAQSEDVAGVAEVLADSFHSREGVFGWAHPLLRLGIYEDVSNRLRSASPHHICLVAIDVTATSCNNLAGTVEMAVRAITPGKSDRSNEFLRHSYQHPYLSNLAVHPNYRRRGVAGQLLASCEKIALCWGFHNLYLHVLENNHQARQLYFKMGYQLDRLDASWNTWVLRKPRQLLLHKRLD